MQICMPSCGSGSSGSGQTLGNPELCMPLRSSFVLQQSLYSLHFLPSPGVDVSFLLKQQSILFLFFGVFFVLVWFLVFFKTGFLCPGTHSADQAGLKLRNPPASASQVLGLKACATTTQPSLFFKGTGNKYLRTIIFVFFTSFSKGFSPLDSI